MIPMSARSRAMRTALLEQVTVALPPDAPQGPPAVVIEEDAGAALRRFRQQAPLRLEGAHGIEIVAHHVREREVTRGGQEVGGDEEPVARIHHDDLVVPRVPAGGDDPDPRRDLGLAVPWAELP